MTVNQRVAEGERRLVKIQKKSLQPETVVNFNPKPENQSHKQLDTLKSRYTHIYFNVSVYPGKEL